MLFDALKAWSDRRFESFDLVSENARLSEKIILLETKVDTLVDREFTLESRATYWREMYVSICRKYKLLHKRYKNLPKQSIILYR